MLDGDLVVRRRAGHLDAALPTASTPHLFTEGDGFQHADASFPLFVFTFLVALGIDYNIFLMTRVREETQARGTRAGQPGRPARPPAA